MKIKRTTIDRYWQWKESAKKSAKFTHNGVAHSQSEFESLIGHKPAEKSAEPINTTVEHSYGDMEEQEHTGDTEES